MSLVDSINRTTRRIPPWTLYIVGVIPAAWYFYLGVVGRLGVDPVKELEHSYGELALQLLIAGLCVTPLRRFTGIALIRFRRQIGLLAFFYVFCHLLVWLFLDVQILGQIWADILKRPYITIGMAGFVCLIPLAATSNNASVRKLGRRWRTLHKLTYLAVLLGAIHFILLAKGFQLEPLLYLGAILLLLGLRIRLPRRAQPA